MKYIITAKGTHNVNAGDGSYDSGTPVAQTECATELIVNRLAVIDMLNRGYVDRNHTIVTLPERTFLYKNLFKNVEVYDKNKVYNNSIDLVAHSTLLKITKSLPYKPFYQNYERDKKDIHDIDYNLQILNSELDDFLVCIPRLKNSDTRRNLDQRYWSEFITFAKAKFNKIIVFGKGNKNLDDGGKVTYVDTLRDFCSYLHHKSCKIVISTVAGPCHYAQFFSNSDNQTKLIMIDNLNLIGEYGDDPSYFHPCLNFTKIEINFIKELLEPEKLSEML